MIGNIDPGDPGQGRLGRSIERAVPDTVRFWLHAEGAAALVAAGIMYDRDSRTLTCSERDVAAALAVTRKAERHPSPGYSALTGALWMNRRCAP